MTARHWIMVFNNPPTLIDFNHPEVRYAVYQEEVGADTGNYHFQGYIELNSPQRHTWFANNIENSYGAHFEKKDGTRDQARHYATKPHSGCDCKHCVEERANPTKISEPIEFGRWEEGGQGSRNDIPEILAEIRSGASQLEIADAHPRAWVQYRNSFNAYQQLVIPDAKALYDISKFRRPPLDLAKPVLLCGPARIGKTQFALAHFKCPLYISHLDDLRRIDKRHDGLVFDDMSFKHLPAETVIHLLDMETSPSIHLRNTNAIIPLGIKRIFTHNEPDIFFPIIMSERQREGIIDRFVLVEVTKLK